ncbi:MAG: hypothetical protein ACTHMS_21750 [Jatrophihabitans sp.]|uniref:hypothetical protein n=1 Tax=Jatrophihabitans sp. TaxID=1932789 RepID=UPI003F7FF923
MAADSSKDEYDGALDQDSEPTMTAPPSERPLGDWAQQLDDDAPEPHSDGTAEDADVADTEAGGGGV